MEKETFKLNDVIMGVFGERELTLAEYKKQTKLCDVHDKLFETLNEKQKEQFDLFDKLSWDIHGDEMERLVDFVLDFVRAVIGR